MRAGNCDRYGKERSGPDRLFEHQFAVLDRQDDGRLRRIALAVERDRSGDSVILFGRGNRITKFGAVGRSGPLDCLDQDPRRIVAQRGDRIGDFVVLGAEFFHKILDDVAGIFGAVMVAIERAFHCRPADLEQFR